MRRPQVLKGRLSFCADRASFAYRSRMISQRVKVTRDPDPAHVVAILDGIDGAWDRAQLGIRQAESGETFPLDEL